MPWLSIGTSEAAAVIVRNYFGFRFFRFFDGMRQDELLRAEWRRLFELTALAYSLPAFAPDGWRNASVWLRSLRELGFTLPSAAYIVGVVMFGFAGLLAYYDGKRHARKRERWIGIALMLYPYAISETWLLYAIGLVLCVAAWWSRAHAASDRSTTTTQSWPRRGK